MSAYIFDTETTGKFVPHIIEYALGLVEGPAKPRLIEPMWKGTYHPEKEIELSAQIVHHIFLEDLVGCPRFTEFQFPADIQYLIGYNIDYDYEAACNSGDQPNPKRIDLFPLSRSIWPDLDSYKQTAVYYFLQGIKGREVVKQAHSAETDVRICFVILKKVIELLKPETWDELWVMSEESRVPEIMPFGKHVGLHMSEVPLDYKKWLLSQDDVDKYLRIALQRRKWD
jgi:exodeoxyribonuclease X